MEEFYVCQNRGFIVLQLGHKTGTMVYRLLIINALAIKKLCVDHCDTCIAVVLP